MLCGLVFFYWGFFAKKHIASVKSHIHLHCGYSRFFFAVDYAPLNGACTSVFRQKRRVNVYAPKLRIAEYAFRQNSSKRHHNYNFRVNFSYYFKRFFRLHFIGLKNIYVMFQRKYLHRRRGHYITASFGLIGLCKNAFYIMSRFNQRLKTRHRKIGRSHKQYVQIIILRSNIYQIGAKITVFAAFR